MPNALTPCPSPGGRGEPVNPRLAARRAAKAALLPRAAALAPSFAATDTAGRSCQEVAAKLRVAKSTVDNLPSGKGDAEGPSLADASGFDAHSLARASGFDGAGAVNGGPAKKPRDWRKSLARIDLRRRLDELSSVPRSATLPNDVLQKRGRGKAGKNRIRGTHYLFPAVFWFRAGVLRLEDRADHVLQAAGEGLVS